jgi:iron complex outermembrane receptor protein
LLARAGKTVPCIGVGRGRCACGLVLAAAAGCHSLAWGQADAPVKTLPAVTVVANAGDDDGDGAAAAAARMSPGAIGTKNVVALDQPGGATALDSALVDAGLAGWDANNSYGMAPGLSVRGFTLSDQNTTRIQASRVLLNGHADIAWRFARDPATLESAELLTGSDATLVGAATPGGVLMLTSKAPTGSDFARARTELGSHGLKRMVLDGERDFGALQLRAVSVLHAGEKVPEGVVDRHGALLLSGKLALGAGVLRLDVEEDGNRFPYTFGAPYEAGRFWLNQSYVDTQRSTASRNYHRQALYWKQPLGVDTDLSLHAQKARSTRRETLLGWFDLLDEQRLDGYYRVLEEHNRQFDLGARVDGRLQTGAARHLWSVAWLRHGQNREFSGPQNISGFTLDLEHPVFPADLGALLLAPRFNFQRYGEQGLGAAWRTDWQAWELRAGLRRSFSSTWSSATPNAPLNQTQHAMPLTHALALGRKLGGGQRGWVSYTQSFMPNIGQFYDGGWLPASRGAQCEAGWAWRADAQAAGSGPREASAALFHIRQSNLTDSDPKHPDFSILRGGVQSNGVELRGSARTGPLLWQASVAWQRVRLFDAADGGREVAGVPSGFGALRVSMPVTETAQAWLRLSGVRRRPGDAGASFYAPGHGLLDVGVQGRLGQSATWGATLDNALDRTYVRALTGPDNVWQGQRRRARVWAEWQW